MATLKLSQPEARQGLVKAQKTLSLQCTPHKFLSLSPRTSTTSTPPPKNRFLSSLFLSQDMHRIKKWVNSCWHRVPTKISVGSVDECDGRPTLFWWHSDPPNCTRHCTWGLNPHVRLALAVLSPHAGILIVRRPSHRPPGTGNRFPSPGWAASFFSMSSGARKMSVFVSLRLGAFEHVLRLFQASFSCTNTMTNRNCVFLLIC